MSFLMLHQLLLLPGLCLATAEPVTPESFTVYSEPIKLRYGEVYNKQQGPMVLPQSIVERYFEQGKAMAITGFDVDMVRKDAAGTESKVKLSDHYLHHYILAMGDNSTMMKIQEQAAKDEMFARMLHGCHGMTRWHVQSFLTSLTDSPELVYFGSAAGAEYRHNPQRCSPEFEKTGNPSCHLATYAGGWRCCEHGVFLIDTDKECSDPQCSEEPQDEIFMKCMEAINLPDFVRVRYTFYFEDASPDTRKMEFGACCDVTSGNGDHQGVENIEYDIPACAPGTPPEECLHVVEAVQPVGFYHTHPKSPNDRHRADELVDLVFAAPHLHLAGLSLELIDDITNKTLCSVVASADNQGGVMYGNGNEAGNEDGYLVGLRPCTWGSDAPRFQRNHPLRARAVYNASRGHTGVMSLWLMDVSAASDGDFVV